MILGTAALLAALIQYVVQLGEYAALGLRIRVRIGFVVGVALVVVGAIAFTELVTQL